MHTDEHKGEVTEIAYTHIKQSEAPTPCALESREKSQQACRHEHHEQHLHPQHIAFTRRTMERRRKPLQAPVKPENDSYQGFLVKDVLDRLSPSGINRRDGHVFDTAFGSARS